MSFINWNLSSDEENGFDDWANVDLQESLQQQNRKFANHNDDGESSEDEIQNRNAIATVAFLSEDYPVEENDDEEEEEEEDEVDWEDAVEENNVDDDSKLPADNTALGNLKPVTLDMNEKPKTENKKRERNKATARRKFRFESLSPSLQRFLSNLERAYLLSCTGHTMYASKYCSGDEPLHVAHSLIPSAWINVSLNGDPEDCAPTKKDLSHFCNVFFDLVNRGRQTPRWTVRPRAGKSKKTESGKRNIESKVNQSEIRYRTKDYCSYLSRNHEQDAQQRDNSEGKDFNEHDRVHLLVSMARSLGWRARYVIAVDAIKKDVDPDHPLFVTTTARNIFQRVWRDQVKNNGGGKKPAKRPRTECTENQGASRGVIPQFLFGDTPTTRPISWVEILCQSDDTDKQKRQAKFKPDGKPKMRWIHVDPRYELVNEPGLVEAALHAERKERASLNEKVKIPISYALAAEHIDISCETRMRLTDVTPRYASSMIESLKTRGILRGKQNQVKDKERVDKWLTETLKFMNSGGKSRDETLFSKGKSLSDAIVLDDASVDGDTKAKSDKDIEEVDDHEKEELKASSQDEPLPTSKTAFNTHPVYVIPSVLNQNEVLVPDAKERICGVFKGELVFRRVDVQCAFPAKRWLYKGRKVKESEFNNPIKRVKAKAKSSKGFKALKSYGIGTDNDGSEEARAKIIAAASRPLDDNKEDLYASWQTDSWAPVPVGANEPIPVNEFNNIELELLNPGLAHVEEHRIAVVAKKLGIPYAPCLLGFEGHRGNRTPTIRGIVVHEHNADLLREAHVEMASQLIEEEHESKQQSVYQKWKRLLVGVLTKDRLDKAYGHDDG